MRRIECHRDNGNSGAFKGPALIGEFGDSRKIGRSFVKGKTMKKESRGDGQGVEGYMDNKTNNIFEKKKAWCVSLDGHKWLTRDELAHTHTHPRAHTHARTRRHIHARRNDVVARRS